MNLWEENKGISVKIADVTMLEEDMKQKAIKYYLEGNGFRRIERLLHVSHVSVINWVKKAADEIRKQRKFNN